MCPFDFKITQSDFLYYRKELFELSSVFIFVRAKTLTQVFVSVYILFTFYLKLQRILPLL